MRVSVPLSDHIYWGESKNGSRRRILRSSLICIFGIIVVFHGVSPVGGMIPGDGIQTKKYGFDFKILIAV